MRKPCIVCGALTPNTRCPQHPVQRGTRQQRGYDQAHINLRNRWNPLVQTGTVPCARCGQLIQPGHRWALDHTDDRTGYLGPSHGACNERAGGSK